MTTAPASRPIELAPTATRISAGTLALVLALLSLPGVVITWGVVPGGGFTTGVPLAIAAIALARRSRRDAGKSRRALAALLIGALALVFVAVCTVALSL